MKQIKRAFAAAISGPLTTAICVALVGLVLAPGTAKAEYPERPITWIVMWSAGGGADTATRALTSRMEEALGREIVVQNITGGGGSAGYLAAKAAQPDGYTLVTIQADLPKFRAMDAAPIDIEDFDIIGSHAVQSPMLAVRADSPWETMEEFIEAARAESGTYSVGVSDLYGAHNQPVVMLADLADIDVRSVAHEGSPQMTAAILGGHVDMVSNWVRPMVQHVEEGTLRFLAYAASERHEDYPDVPTLRELGYDVVIEFPYGVGGPAGLPEEAKQKLTEALEFAWQSDEMWQELEQRGLSPFRLKGEEFREHLLRMQRDVSHAVELVRARSE